MRTTADASVVHVFASDSGFASESELLAFVATRYTEDGDALPSAFAEETGLRDCEPGCIESIFSETRLPVWELLKGFSCDDAWIGNVRSANLFKAAICAFAPNHPSCPEQSSLTYLGAYAFDTGATHGDDT